MIGGVEARRRFAILLSLMLECALAGVNPEQYPADVIDKIAADWPAARADELLPRAWRAAREPEQDAGDRAVGEPAAAVES